MADYKIKGTLTPIKGVAIGEQFSLDIPPEEEAEYYGDRYKYVEQMLTKQGLKFNEIHFVVLRSPLTPTESGGTSGPKSIHLDSCAWVVF